MAKLYLIRRNLEAFTGPMTLMELKDAYKRMQFGLQDEVSGHCGPWVTLENLERVKKQYPDVARIVHEDMVGAWGVATDSDAKFIKAASKRAKVKSTRGVGLAMVFLAIAIAAFVAAIYMANSARMSSKAKEQPDHNIKPEDAQSLLEKGDREGFNRLMQTNIIGIVEQVQQQKVYADAWLPYLRSYVFSHDGQMAGLDPKILRGTAIAPVDCSLKMWSGRWRGSYRDWNEFLSDHKLVHAHWARILAWDPNWIKHRDNKGWLSTENYYSACLTMAQRALNDLVAEGALSLNRSELDRMGLNKIKSRLEWQISSIKGAAMPEVSSDPTASLAGWTCLEAAHDLTSLQKCRAALARSNDIWNEYNEERFGWNLLRLASAIRGAIPTELSNQISQLAGKMHQEDHFTRFDYQTEARLLNAFVTRELSPVKSAEQAQPELPNVKLSH